MGIKYGIRPEPTPAPDVGRYTHSSSQRRFLNAGRTPSRGSAASLSDARRVRDSCCACAWTSQARAPGKGRRVVVARRRLCNRLEVALCCSLWVAARRPSHGMNLYYPSVRGRRRCWAAESHSWGCKCRRWLCWDRGHRVVLLQAEVAADRDLVVGRADVEDLLVAEAGCVRLWRVACGHLYPDPGAIVVVWCYQVVAVLFCRRNDVEAALEDHDPFLRTLGRCGSRCHCNVDLEGSTRRDPFRQYLQLEQVGGSFSSLGLFGESRVRDCPGTLASPRAWRVQDEP